MSETFIEKLAAIIRDEAECNAGWDGIARAALVYLAAYAPATEPCIRSCACGLDTEFVDEWALAQIAALKARVAELESELEKANRAVDSGLHYIQELRDENERLRKVTDEYACDPKDRGATMSAVDWAVLTLAELSGNAKWDHAENGDYKRERDELRADLTQLEGAFAMCKRDRDYAESLLRERGILK